MNKSVLVLSIALAGSVAMAFLLGRDLQRERARADALAERLFELEPLEKGSSSILTDADLNAQAAAYVAARQAVEPPIEQPVLNDPPEHPRAVKEYHGTLRTRRQVERLELALATGTPLQEYQIQPLISAIDKIRSEIEQKRAKGDASRNEAESEANQRIVQAADDILFESQLEKLIELLDSELEMEMNVRSR